ncbi:ArsR/SmtB family transcription factor [Streptomyces sp. NPDC050585]|uniref:ArsR/SmtB family transcription factor n=1 Tax=Streptomyces sp. NPDC050585 TaxID=3365632 RepID=UPI0037BC1D00
MHTLVTLAHPHRLRVVAALSPRRTYVSQPARELGMSRALLQTHLRKLEAAGPASERLGISSDGKAMRFYEVTPFALHLTPKPSRLRHRRSAATPSTTRLGGPPPTAPRPPGRKRGRRRPPDPA